MEIKLHTKFNLDQEVYICRKTRYFKSGSFTEGYVVDEIPKVIKGMHVAIFKDKPTEILYHFGGVELYSENYIFSTLEEAIKWCDSYE